jgi:hypothetical protein
MPTWHALYFVHVKEGKAVSMRRPGNCARQRMMMMTIDVNNLLRNY